MLIDVPRLKRGGERLKGEEPAGVLGLAEEDIQADGPVRYDVTAYEAWGELIVRGRLWTRVSFRCARCAELFPQDIEEPDFLSAHEIVDPGALVDLTPEVRESIILRFPDHPMCRTECRGLCSRCGANLNRERCDCRPTDARWSALEGLSLGRQGEGAGRRGPPAES